MAAYGEFSRHLENCRSSIPAFAPIAVVEYSENMPLMKFSETQACLLQKQSLRRQSPSLSKLNRSWQAEILRHQASLQHALQPDWARLRLKEAVLQWRSCLNLLYLNENFSCIKDLPPHVAELESDYVSGSNFSRRIEFSQLSKTYMRDKTSRTESASKTSTK